MTYFSWYNGTTVPLLRLPPGIVALAPLAFAEHQCVVCGVWLVVYRVSCLGAMFILCEVGLQAKAVMRKGFHRAHGRENQPFDPSTVLVVSRAVTPASDLAQCLGFCVTLTIASICRSILVDV